MPKIRRYAGFANESAFAVSPAPAAAEHVDMTSATLDVPSDTEMVYPGALHRAGRLRRPGFYVPQGNVVYGFDVRTVARHLRNALGGYLFTAGAPLNTHEMWAVDDYELPSFCTRIGKDQFEHVFSGCVTNSLQLQTEGEWAQATIDIRAAKDAKADLLDLDDLLLPDEFPLAFLDLTLTRAGAPELGVKVRGVTLEIQNNIRPESGRQSGGSRHPARLPVGDRLVQGTADVFFESLDELERFWGDPDGPSADGSTEFPVEMLWDAGDDGSVNLEMPRSWWTQVQQQPSGRDEIVQQCAFRCLVDEVTIGGQPQHTEIHVTVENGVGDLAA